MKLDEAATERRERQKLRLEKLAAISRKRHELSITSDWRYPRFLDFLQISPSYRLAHLLAVGKVKRRGLKLPADFAEVELTYAAFGDVTRTYFWDWWLKTAQYQFGASLKPEAKVLLKLNLKQEPSVDDIEKAKSELADYLYVDRPAQGNQALMVVALPVHTDRKTMLKAFEKLLDANYGSQQKPVGVAPYSIIRNKMRENTLMVALKVLRARAALPNERLFVIGHKTKVSPANEITDFDRRARGEYSNERKQMEILTSRHLHRAYLLAENAARGRFPSLDPLPDDPNRPPFDYKQLNAQFRAFLKWGELEKGKLKQLSNAGLGDRA
jgi:hypothetical protein